MANKEKIKGLTRKLAKHPIKSIIALGLAGLITITAVKDNVHFGSVALYNPQENHYTWGLAPVTEIKGNAKGNFYTAGLISGGNKLADNIILDGDMSAYGVFGGGNDVGDNSKVNDMSVYGVFGGNEVGDNSKVNDMSVYGVLGGNDVGNNSKVNDMSVYGVLGFNKVRDNSKVNDMSAYGVLIGDNDVGDNTEINGDIHTKGIAAGNFFGLGFGSNDEIGLKNYVHKLKKIDKEK